MKIRGKIVGIAVAMVLGTSAYAQDAVPVKVGMNFVMNGQFLPIVVAKQRGYYEEAGLDVTIEEGKSSSVAAQLVATGQLDFAYGDGPTGMQVASKGAPVVTVLTVFATNPFSITSLASTGIKTAQDLVGKKIGVSAGGAQMVLIPRIDQVNGLEGKYELLPMDGSAQFPALLQGQVDGIHVAADKAIALEDQGATVSQLYLRDIGAPTVGPGIMVNTATLESKPDVVRAFLAATLRGVNDAFSDPESAAADAHELYPQLSAEQFLKQFAAVQPFICAPNSDGIGRAADENWQLAGELLIDSGALPADVNLDDFYTYAFLPEDLQACPK